MGDGWGRRGRRTAARRDRPENGDADFVGVGDVRLVRTFRVGAGGELFPVNSATAWRDGWNTATCGRGHSHTPPDPECRCGFYVYADPAYVLAQPPGRQTMAVVSVNGPMEAGSRGARVQRARVEAIWLGPRVRDELAAAVGRRYPSTRVFRDRTAMDAAFPLTRLDGFAAPHVGEHVRRRLRVPMWSFLVAVTATGCVPAQTVVGTYLGAAAWLTLLAVGLAAIFTGLAQASPIVGLQGAAAVGWLVTAGPRTPSQWAMRVLLVVLMAWVVVIWWRAGEPGRRIRDPRLDRALRRWRGPSPKSR